MSEFTSRSGKDKRHGGGVIASAQTTKTTTTVATTVTATTSCTSASPTKTEAMINQFSNSLRAKLKLPPLLHAAQPSAPPSPAPLERQPQIAPPLKLDLPSSGRRINSTATARRPIEEFPLVTRSYSKIFFDGKAIKEKKANSMILDRVRGRTHLSLLSADRRFPSGNCLNLNTFHER